MRLVNKQVRVDVWSNTHETIRDDVINCILVVRHSVQNPIINACASFNNHIFTLIGGANEKR